MENPSNYIHLAQCALNIFTVNLGDSHPVLKGRNSIHAKLSARQRHRPGLGNSSIPIDPNFPDADLGDGHGQHRFKGIVSTFQCTNAQVGYHGQSEH